MVERQKCLVNVEEALEAAEPRKILVEAVRFLEARRQAVRNQTVGVALAIRMMTRMGRRVSLPGNCLTTLMFDVLYVHLLCTLNLNFKSYLQWQFTFSFYRIVSQIQIAISIFPGDNVDRSNSNF